MSTATSPLAISKRNEHAIGGLKALLNSDDKPIAFVGAGVGAMAKLKDWKTLLDAMHTRLKEASAGALSAAFLETLANLSDYTWRAEEYKIVLKDQFFKVLTENLSNSDAPRHEIYQQVLNLEFKHFLTTNFDTCLEEAADEDLNIVNWFSKIEAQNFLRLVTSPPTQQRSLVYLHGRLGDNDSIVFTDRDYVNRYVATDETNKKLFALFLTQSLVFIGYSLGDAELTQLLRISHNNLGGGGPPRHYAILPLEDLSSEQVMARLLNGKYGVEPIYYHKQSRDHSQLLVVLDLLGKDSEATMLDPDSDPLKGQFGGESNDNNFSMFASVDETSSPGWFRLEVSVSAHSTIKAATVKIFLHPTFPRDQEEISMVGDKATYVTYAYGAFTVGCKIFDMSGAEISKLELDLSELEGAPKAFREN